MNITNSKHYLLEYVMYEKRKVLLVYTLPERETKGDKQKQFSEDMAYVVPGNLVPLRFCEIIKLHENKKGDKGRSIYN